MAHLPPWGARALGKTIRPKLLFVSSYKPQKPLIVQVVGRLIAFH